MSKPVSKWDNEGRLREDHCEIQVADQEARRGGEYQLSGYDSNRQDYINNMNDRMHFQKVYRDQTHAVDDETALFLSQSTNPRYLNQLYTRPYAGFFCGPGMPSLGNKDVESALQQSLLTNLRQHSCEACRGKPAHRYYHLPDYGNPQKVEKIIQPSPENGGWIRGGAPTRDLVRRVDYLKRCGNQLNAHMIYKGD
jgi:hypothetical protein|uniref:Uncharacterized protein n=1 Tax=viral metagenome TaxID=1070528 RepID=A0A6C0BLP9_9ZZZZ